MTEKSGAVRTIVGKHHDGLPSPMMNRLILFFVFLAPIVSAQPRLESGEWRRVIDLRGQWRFNLGDQKSWSQRFIDDTGWEEIFVPSAWENEGYPGYDGIAWYRRHFKLSKSDQKKDLYLHLGRIDDVDEVFINGHFLGSTGRMHPEYTTGYWSFRMYRIPSEFLDFDGDNVIAIRVYDHELEGGIVEGQVGVYQRLYSPALLVDLSGTWQFKTGDNTAWRHPGSSRQGWSEITVPGWWEPQGFRTYDGYAWYHRTFITPGNLPDDELLLVLGKIDDLDETFLNGRKIGRTGAINDKYIEGAEYQVVRAYPIPQNLLRRNSKNTITVRVYDGLIDGGIYEGPVGIMTRSNFEKRYRSHSKSFIDRFWEWLESL